MKSYRDGIIYIYELCQNLNLIRFLKTFHSQIIQNILVRAMEIFYGAIALKVVALKEYIFQKYITNHQQKMSIMIETYLSLIGQCRS
jgi:hypothetical protein